MKKLRILLCGLGVSFILSGCGAMPELTEEENEIITEYAVGLLLKYDKYYNSRLVDLSAYEVQQDIEQNEPEESNIPEEEPMPEDNDELSQTDPEVVDVSEQQASTIEEFYGIEGFSFQYAGCDLKSEYPDMAEDSADAYFAVQATPGSQLLILKFQVNNYSGSDRELDMLSYGLRTRVAVNGESSKNTLSTMLLNDLRTYKGVVGENGSTELVAIIEVPEGTYVESLSLILRSDSDSAEFVLQ
ncbi:MAG: hypothetical protein K2H31_11695 [Lachnospiraceae bacterium]|nr:hypothetical protein [Lachnospiraceae bacterium]